MNLETLLAEREVLIVCGAGGVGKTTTSAAIALGMARRGRTACVLTIDPARRLADALGIEVLGDEPHEVPLGEGATGRLFALTLDAKRTFDRLIEEYAPTPQAAERILRNRVYGQLSTAIAGSQEYMAMEKLYELRRSGRFDLLVLDTPPTRNALDFLEAPDRIVRFVEGRTLRTFLEGGVKAGRFGLRSLASASALAWKAFERLTGFGLMADLSEFFLAFDGMYDGFRERAQAVRDLLADERSVFLLVATPERAPIAEAVFFWRKLVEAELPFGGVLVNKVHRDGLGGGRERTEEALRRAAAGQLADSGLDADIRGRVVEMFLAYEALARRDAAAVAGLSRRLGTEALLLVPSLDGDVHDVDGLDRLDAHLFPPV